MTFDKLYLEQYKELTTPLEVHLGDNNIKQAQGYGTLTFSLPNNNHLHIHKFHFVPGLTKNLLSVSQETECGYTLTFKGNSCPFESQQANGTSYNSLFQNTKPTPNSHHTHHNIKCLPSNPWHWNSKHPLCKIYVSMELITPRCRLRSSDRRIPFWWRIGRRWLSDTSEPHTHLTISKWLSTISLSLSQARSQRQ